MHISLLVKVNSVLLERQHALASQHDEPCHRLTRGTQAGASTARTTSPPWTTNGPSPVCTSSALLDQPGHRRGTPSNAKPVQGQATGTEYAYFADASTAHECVQRCCSDWSCWGFTFYPVGRVGNNDEPAGPGHSCDGTAPCCVLLNDMYDPVLPSGDNLPHSQSGIRAKLPARWDPSFEASPLIKSAHFGSRLCIGGDGSGGGKPVHPKGRAQGGWDLGDEFPTTWDADGNQYSGAGDNSGGPAHPGTDSPLTLWRIGPAGEPPAAEFSLQGAHVPINSAALQAACPIYRPMPRPEVNQTAGPPNLKSQSMLALDGALHWAVACFDHVDPDLSRPPGPRGCEGLDRVFNRQRYGVDDTSWIVSSPDHGLTWNVSATPFDFFKGRLASPRFINAGQGCRDAPDPAHIYAVFVGTETGKAFFENNDAMWLGRVPRAQLLNRSAWTFFAGLGGGSGSAGDEPLWTADDTVAVSIFTHPLMTAMQHVTYNVGLKRHMMAVWSWVDPDGNPRGQARVFLF